MIDELREYKVPELGEYETGFNDGIDLAISFLATRASDRDCNDCLAVKDCDIIPAWGESVRKNCYFWGKGVKKIELFMPEMQTDHAVYLNGVDPAHHNV